MNKLMVACAVSILASAPAAATDASDVVSAIHQWVDGFNSGSPTAAVATCADETSIIDDFPPHEWHGVGACSRWFGDFQSMSNLAGITGAAISLGEPEHVESSASVAYVVTPTTLSFQRAGNRVVDQGILTVTLRKGGSGWRISGWVWTDR